MNDQQKESQKSLKNEAHLRLLNELSAKVQGTLDSENFFQEVLNIIHSTFQFYAIQFWVFENAKKNQMVLRAQAGAYHPHLQLGHILELNAQSITSNVASTRKSYLCNDVSKDPHFANLSLPVNSLSQLCIPILKDDEIIGTLNVEEDKLNAFEQNDLVALESVAAQVAVALTNQKLFQQVKSFNEKLQNSVEEKTLELRKAHHQILEQQKLLEKENKVLKDLVNKDNKKTEIIGKSAAIESVITMVDKIAPTTATVLIQGESGTGKELIARRLHFMSDRSDKPYITVNCGALQEALLESELFGHEKGSFTGAVVQKTGLAEMADGGTLFLDEIGEMSLGIQAKLLRFLQEGEFYRIGGKKSIKVNVRIISATNKDLEQEVKKSHFREDLYYRLNTITLRMPPLRKRKEDIESLVHFFMGNSRYGNNAQNEIKIDPKVIEALKGYDWPGNIRELQNTLERLKILSDGNYIKIEDVPYNIRQPKVRASQGSETAVGLPLEEVEKNHILKTLQYFQGNKTKTAQSLGVTIKTLYNKLHKYGIFSNNGNTDEEQSA